MPLRLTGEMLDVLATEFPLSNADEYAIDWDEYDDFVPAPPALPDLARGEWFGGADNRRGRFVLAFFRMLDRLWPVR